MNNIITKIINNTKTLRKYKLTFLIIFLICYCLSVVRAIFLLPANATDVLSTALNSGSLLKVHRAIKLILMSIPAILISHIVYVQWDFNIEKEYQKKIIYFWLKLTC